jgi:hypothetical protein
MDTNETSETSETNETNLVGNALATSVNISCDPSLS